MSTDSTTEIKIHSKKHQVLNDDREVLFTGWVDRVSDHPAISIESWDNNGCGNNGEFIASGNTAGADYNITGVL